MSVTQLSGQLSMDPAPAGIQKLTLPVETCDGLVLDLLKARELGAALAEKYRSALPFPHVVIDDFLPSDLADTILAHFPSTPRAGDVIYRDRLFEHHKRQVLPDYCDEYARRVFTFFNSAAILGFLEALTNIDGLIPDPYFEGSGFHEIARGGKLGLHADFRVHNKLRLNRRINLLLYLNKDWDDGYRGHLELWDRTGKHRIHSIAPLFNRCVIFNTERDSYHGHPDPLEPPEGRTRKSLAMYYYTASERIYEETPRHGTVFIARPEDSGHAKRSATKMKWQTYLSLPEIVPPIIYRQLRALKARWKASKKA
jgi:hypothetical protein